MDKSDTKLPLTLLPADDLIVDQVLTHHDTKLDAYVIQWTNAMSPASKLPIGTFQAWLFPNGTVGYVYRDLYGSEQALGSSAAVGESLAAVDMMTYGHSCYVLLDDF